MSLYTYNPSERYRRRSARRLTNSFMFLMFITLVAGVFFWLGGLRATQDIIMLRQERDTAQQNFIEIQNEVTKLRAEAQTAGVRLEQVRAGYQEILPEGPMQNLVELLRKQLDEGIDEKRLESIILSARPPQNCSTPVSRAFVITTPAYKGPQSKVSIESGTIHLSGDGQSVINEQGKAEAWFDSSKPVTIMFSTKEGVVEKKTGGLPMQYSIVVSDKEYRFNIAQGEQSFAKVTYDYCDYP